MVRNSARFHHAPCHRPPLGGTRKTLELLRKWKSCAESIKQSGDSIRNPDRKYSAPPAGPARFSGGHAVFALRRQGLVRVFGRRRSLVHDLRERARFGHQRRDQRRPASRIPDAMDDDRPRGSARQRARTDRTITRRTHDATLVMSFSVLPAREFFTGRRFPPSGSAGADMREQDDHREFDSSVGDGSCPAERSRLSMIRRFCMSGVSRQSGTLPTSAQVTLSRLPSSLERDVRSRYSSR